jgi:acetyl esterase/lipase
VSGRSFEQRVDPQLAEGLAAFEALALPTEPGAIAACRRRCEEAFAARRFEPSPDLAMHDEPLGVAGAALRIFRPHGAAGLLPLVLWVPGGGMVLSEFESDRPACEALALATGCVVAAVRYRLAPEALHPGPVEDVYAGLYWVAEHARELGVDPARIAIHGVSAGGGLAAAATLIARARGGPALAFQVLVYPMLDDRDATPSMREFSGIPSWNRENNRLGWSSLLGEAYGCDEISSYAAPARADSLTGLPPALVQVAELDVLRDEDIAYAQRLMQAGVPTRLHVYPGAYHGFDVMHPASASGARAIAERADAIRAAVSCPARSASSCR